MSHRTRRHLELLKLARPLQRYATSLQPHPDGNASAFLVHTALAAAFAETPCERPSAGLEASLRADIDRQLAETGSACAAA